MVWSNAFEVGYLLLVVAAVCLLVAILGTLRLTKMTQRLGWGNMALLVGLAGTWIFLTLTIGVVGWIVWKSPAGPFTIGSSPIAGPGNVDLGPITWLQGFTGMDGGFNGNNVFALRFQGANTSKEAVHLKSADITSLVDGTRLSLEIVGSDADGVGKIVALDRVQLVPPGAPIELVAKFGPPDPAGPGLVKGIEPKVFLDKWRQFAFDAADNKRTYHFEVNENAFMPFFKGKVGPRVALKPD